MSLQPITAEMTALLRTLRKKVVIGVVSESDFVKISEQLSPPGSRGTASFLAPRFRACVLMS